MAVSARTLGTLKQQMRESSLARMIQEPVEEFIHTQGMSSLVLLAAAIAAVVWANSRWSDSYNHAWHIELTLSGLSLPIHAWINDALMALFFFLVGMEIKHEIVHGELTDIRRAFLPVAAGLGGMVVPALIYATLNHGRPAVHGWGIPMATDIAFSLGVLTLVKGVPAELKVFLLTLAIADDIGAIVVIAVFYTRQLSWSYLVIAALLIAVILLCKKIGFEQPVLYAALGFGVWLAVLRSGVHATIAGVILGFLIPVTPRISFEEFSHLFTEMAGEFREAQARGDSTAADVVLGGMEHLLQHTESAADRLTRKMNDWIAFVVLPLFALANAGVTFSAESWGPFFHSRVAWGVLLGLLLGKPAGISAACWLTAKLRLTQVPSSVTWMHVLGVSTLAGIGFTVSLFIAALAFDDPAQLDAAKTAVLLASVVAGIAGFLLLKRAVASAQPKG